MAQTFVLDCSVAISWCFIDESSSYADEVLDSLTHATAIVPIFVVAGGVQYFNYGRKVQSYQRKRPYTFSSFINESSYSS
jgi:hypothetical protein